MVSRRNAGEERDPRPTFIKKLSSIEEDNFIMKQTNQLSKSKKKNKEAGVEYDPDIQSDWELCKKIFESKEYNLNSDSTKIDKNVQQLIETSMKGDKRTIASIIGIHLLGMMAFAQMSYDFKDQEGFKGMGIGYRASRKLAKLAKQHKLTNENLYTLKLRYLLKLGAVHEQELKFNLNKYRAMLEKILAEFAPAFDYTIYSDLRTIDKRLTKLHKFFLTAENQKTMLLSYKLFKTYLKVADEGDEEKKKETANKIYTVFQPFVLAMEYRVKNLKKIQHLVSYVKVKKFIQSEEMQAILKKFPNVTRTVTALAVRKEMLKKPVNLQEKIGQIMNWGPNEAKDFLNSDVIQNSLASSPTEGKVETHHKDLKLTIKATNSFFKYDSDTEEHTPGTTDLRALTAREFNHNSNHLVVHSESPNRGLSRDVGFHMHESLHHSSKLVVHSVENDFPEEGDYFIDDPYLCRSLSKPKTSILKRKTIILMPNKGKEEDKIIVEIDTKTEITFQKLLSIAYDNVSKWDVIKNDSVMKICKIKPENSPVVLIRAWSLLENITPEQIFTCIYDTKIRPKWDTVIANPTSLDKIDEYNDYFYFMIKAPIGVSNRDFVQKRCFRKNYPDPGHIIISFQSTHYDKVPPKKGVIRAETHIAGYIIKPVNNGKDSELYIISQVDIKGSIPKAIVNLVAGKAPAEWIVKLKKACHGQIDG